MPGMTLPAGCARPPGGSPHVPAGAPPGIARPGRRRCCAFLPAYSTRRCARPQTCRWPALGGPITTIPYRSSEPGSCLPASPGQDRKLCIRGHDNRPAGQFSTAPPRHAGTRRGISRHHPRRARACCPARLAEDPRSARGPARRVWHARTWPACAPTSATAWRPGGGSTSPTPAGAARPPAPRHHPADPRSGPRQVPDRQARPRDRRAAPDEHHGVQAVPPLVGGPRLRRHRQARLDPGPAPHGPDRPRGPQRAPGPGPVPAPRKTRRTPPRTSPRPKWPPIWLP